jgi:hypothetical protein
MSGNEGFSARITQKTSFLDSMALLWLLVVLLFATGFGAACLIVFKV